MLRDDHSQHMATVRDVGKGTVSISWEIAPNCGVGNEQLTVGRGNHYFDGDPSPGVSSVSRTTSATRFMVVRRSMAARWIHLNASGSVIP